MSLYMSGLEPRIVRQFIAIVEHGSFKLAASHLHISQAALSTSIARLEEKLCVKLFERMPRGVSPTIYGETLYRRAKIAQTELGMAVEEIDLIRSAKKGSVTFGSGKSVLSNLITNLIIKVSGQRPNIEMMVLSGPEKTLFTAVAQGDAEFAITSCSSGPLPDGISYEVLYEMGTYPIVSKKHPLAKLTRIDWQKMRQYPWIIVDPNSEPSEREVFSILSRMTPKTVIKTDSPNLIKSVVRKSDFITFMPGIMISQEEDKDLTTIGPPKGIYRTPMGIITRAQGFLSPGAEYVINEIRAICSELRDHQM